MVSQGVKAMWPLAYSIVWHSCYSVTLAVCDVQVAELRVAFTTLEQQTLSAAQRAKREQHHVTDQLTHVQAEVAALTEDRYELQVCF